MGYVSGTSTVWNAEYYGQDNPALLGYLNGMTHRFTWGTTDYVSINESKISFGFKGIGFSFLAPSNNWKLGFVQHVKDTMIDETVFSSTGEDFESFDTSQKFSVGMNMFRFLEDFKFIRHEERFYKLSFGLTMHRQSREYMFDEITIFDLISLRKGQYDEDREYTSLNNHYSTSGIGIHAGNESMTIFGNIAFISGASEILPVKVFEFGLNIDFIRLFGK